MTETGDTLLVIGAIMEHIEEAGVHSGDSTCVLPPHTLDQSVIDEVAEAAKALAAELSVMVLMNIQFSIKGDAIYVLDLLHHIPKEAVPGFLGKLRQNLREGGMLIVKEVEDRPRWKMWFTLILDRLMVGFDPIHYWSSDEMTALLEQHGFSVRRHRMRDILPYPHILYVCHSKLVR